MTQFYALPASDGALLYATTAAQEMLGDSVSVYLDGGPTPGNVPSSIVQLLANVPRAVW